MDIEESKKQFGNDSEFVTTWDFPSRPGSSVKQKDKIIFEEYLLNVKLFSRWLVSKSVLPHPIDEEIWALIE